MIAELRRSAPSNVTAVTAKAEDVDESWGHFRLATAGRAFHWFDTALVLARLATVTPALALVGDDIRDSEAQSLTLAIAVEVIDEAPIEQPKSQRRHLAPIHGDPWVEPVLRGRSHLGRGRTDLDARRADRHDLLDSPSLTRAAPRENVDVRGTRPRRTCSDLSGTSHRRRSHRKAARQVTLLTAQARQFPPSARCPHLTAFFTSERIFVSSAAVRSFSANATGHMAPWSRFALSLKPNIAYLSLNLPASRKKQTTLPFFA